MTLNQDHQRASFLKPYLIECGYNRARLIEHVEVTNGRRVSLVAFAHAPFDSRSACIAVIDTEANVVDYRSVGAPIVFVATADGWQVWKQAVGGPTLLEPALSLSKLNGFFKKYKNDLAPEAVYRAKTWARFDKTFQLGFVDLGLMPLVEEEAGKKLSELVERIVISTKENLGWDVISQEQAQWLVKSNFWLLAAKILKDKGVPTFADLNLEFIEDVYKRVAHHYGAHIPLTSQSAKRLRALAGSAYEISRFSHLGIVSTDALAYLYENALITKKTRAQFGTHSTPTYLVDYIVGKLRPWIEKIPTNQRQVFEPACGHAPFLLAALRLLGDLEAESVSTPRNRHQYFQQRLHGIDFDEFAVEIARLSLTLGDVPNRNGWDVQVANMFNGNLLAQRSSESNIILSNPPFQSFSSSQGDSSGEAPIGTKLINKAGEMLWQVVTSMKPGAVIGVVVPQGILQSVNAKPLRKFIATHFDIDEICLLPDKVFRASGAESAVLLGRRLQPNMPRSRATIYRHVRDRDVKDFKKSYSATVEYNVPPSRFSEQHGWSFFIPDLEDVWEFCRPLPRLIHLARIGKGFEFIPKENPAFPKGATTVSREKKEGFVEGWAKLDPHLQTHQLPMPFWLNLNLVLTSRIGTSSGIPQVLLNYTRVSREPWRLKAFIDREGLPFTTRFVAIRPRDTGIPLEVLWSLCNSPLANAFSYTHTAKREAGLLLKDMPVPDLSNKSLKPLLEAVHRYLEATSAAEGILTSVENPEVLKALHLRIDAEVLRLYELPAHLEMQVLKLFSGTRRRGVPFVQNEYLPQTASWPLSLHDFLAISLDWNKTNTRRSRLILKKANNNISQSEMHELNDLQRLTDARIKVFAPLPLNQLEMVRAELKRRRLWEED